ncbi:MAG TPA: hypothetical protein VNS55_12120 [Nocardioides sp.]|nr:hypothetical protein [Nocardioides sp.]
MGIIRNWRRGAAALLAVTAVVAATASPTSAESVTYAFAKSPYVKSIKISNGSTRVVVRYVARPTPASVRFTGWSIDLDTVADHSSDVGAGEFTVYGPWRRERAKVIRYADDGSYDQSTVSCDKLKTTRVGKVKTVVVPRSCLKYGDAKAVGVRVRAGVYGDKVTPSGGSCWGVVAPRRGWTDVLQPGAARLSARQSRVAVAARGC